MESARLRIAGEMAGGVDVLGAGQAVLARNTPSRIQKNLYIEMLGGLAFQQTRIVGMQWMNSAIGFPTTR